MERIFIFIKHHLKPLWRILEWGNGFIYSMLFRTKQKKVLKSIFDEQPAPPYEYRKLLRADAVPLYDLINSQQEADLTYFQPHGFDRDSVEKQFSNRAFLMMGVFEKERILGYFFLRFFANRKCFVGRLIDKEYRGKGIGLVMNKIMYETAWRMGFRCLSTISNNNKAVIEAHAKNPSMVVLKELRNDYLLVEFVNTQDEKSL